MQKVAYVYGTQEYRIARAEREARERRERERQKCEGCPKAVACKRGLYVACVRPR